MRTRVKICGITSRQDAEFAVNFGADAIGLVFYPKSPRAVTIAQAKDIIERLPPFVSVVALFVDEKPNTVIECLKALPIDLLQFHGNESPDYCEQFEHPYIKAVRMRESVDLQVVVKQYQKASALLLDSYQPGVPGGTGQIFNWSWIAALEKPIILAGGLNSKNIASAIQQVKPYAVDVSGGVELEKGIKDKEKIHAFMREVING
jgi:phosphoribosylanthranilate isomerase